MASVFFFGLSPGFYLATSGTKWFENQRKLLPQSNGGNVEAWARKDQGKWREIGNQSGIAWHSDTLPRDHDQKREILTYSLSIS